jgi:hypothetical protein
MIRLEKSERVKAEYRGIEIATTKAKTNGKYTRLRINFLVNKDVKVAIVYVEIPDKKNKKME